MRISTGPRSRSRIRFPGQYQIPLLLTAVVWFCSLPLITIVAVPFVGPVTAAYVAAVALAVALMACFIFCTAQKTRKE